MKYNFVYDTDFFEKNSLYLSEEEKDVVFATVVGKHNAIFYGHNPERLVNAVKFLSHSERFVEQKSFSDIETGLVIATKGIMHLKDFDAWAIAEQEFLYGHTKNVPNRSTQFIATTTHTPFAVMSPFIIDNFDIIYKCEDNDIQPYLRGNLENMFKGVLNYRGSLRSAHYITSTELEVKEYWLWKDAYEYLCNMQKSCPVIAHKVAVVSRSVSDCRKISCTNMDDILYAEKLTGARHEI